MSYTQPLGPDLSSETQGLISVSHVTWGKLLHVPKAPFPHLQNGYVNPTILFLLVFILNIQAKP